MLKYKNVKTIDVDDWDNLVEKTYGKIYSFQQQDGCKERQMWGITVPSDEYDFEATEMPFEVNGSEEGISFETWLNTTPEDTAKHFDSEWENRLFWDRNFYPEVGMVINDLHKKGLIEAGEYNIDIDW